MNLTEIAFKYRRTVIMIVALMLINGIFAYFTLPAREDPSITIREATVVTAYPGMAAERVEQLITKTLEEEIRQLAEIESIRSTSSTGLSVIHVEIFDRYFDLDAIWQRMRDRVQEAQSQLPDGTRPSIINDTVGDVSVVTLALTADGFTHGQMFDKAKHIRDALYGVAGTKKIELLGVQDERIFLETSNAKLANIGISPGELIRELQNQNIISSGGQADTGLKTFIIEPTGNYRSVDDIGDTYIQVPNSQDYVALKDIVDIRRGYVDPPNQPAYFNGEQAIVFAIAMQPEFNILEYAPRIMDKVHQLEQTLPIGYQINVATYQAEQVQKTVNGVTLNVIETLAIVLVVVILFLGLRTGMIVGTIVPFVMLATLTIMQLMDIKLERMSLATLIIALGLLVDNGIVIAEEFKKRLEMGEDRYNAMVQSGKELALPLLSSSATTVLFFLPLMLAEHVAGEYTRSVSLVIFITLFTSWFLALCVTPIFCYYFIKVSSTTTDGYDTGFYKHYKQLLATILAHKLLFGLGAIAALFLSFAAMSIVPKQFFPDSDRTQILVYVDLPNGSSSRQTNEQMKDIMAWLSDKQTFPYVDSFSAYVGFGGPRFVLSLTPVDPADNKGFMVLNVAAGTDTTAKIIELDRQLENRFPNISVRVNKMFLGPSDSNTIAIQVVGPDKDVIYQKAQQVIDLLANVPNTLDVRSDWENRITKVIVEVDQKRARRAGVTSSDIASSLQSYFDGAMVTEYREGDDIIPVLFRANAAERNNLDRLRSMSVYSSSTGMAVPLFQVAELKPQNEFSIIQREDLFRTVKIEARNTAMAAEDFKLIIDEQLMKLAEDLPPNHVIQYDGVVVESAEAQAALSASVPFVLAVIFVILVAQFNSFKRAFVIVLTIPLAFVGAVVGLLVMNAPFGFMVSLGIYSLAGIIINNAIVLIDRIDIEQKKGLSAYDAIISASVSRLRPIVMTTITTVMGLLPLIIGNDPLFYGMASVIAFGLGVGTVLTLGVVPLLYAAFYGVKKPT